MAFEGLKNVAGKVWEGTKNSADNLWRGTLGGALDATAGNAYDLFHDTGAIAQRLMAVVGQPVARVIDSVKSLAHLHPFEAGAHLAVGLGKGCENIIEAVRATTNAVLNAGDRVLKGATRMLGGFFLEDVLGEKYVERQVPFTIEGVRSGPVVHHTTFFDAGGVPTPESAAS